MAEVLFPPYLKKNDLIGITCPAGYMEAEKAAACIQTLQEWGYQVMVGKTLGSSSTNYFSGTDEERANELQAMLNNKNIKAILFGRGGYGTGRIITQLKFNQFKRNPKWLIGFSDITVLHNYLSTQLNTASIHGPMAAAFNITDGYTANIDSLQAMLIGKKNRYDIPTALGNRKGKAEGRLIGGNLSLLVNGIGTKMEINTKRKILFIEDIGEQLYQTDRMLHQLKLSGKLQQLAGLVVGGFTDSKDTTRPFGQTLEDIVGNLVKELPIPVCFGFPVSHGKENVALKIGARYQLNVGSKKTSLIEK
jgi:muramoyltetrapeptide carboxypeptidase